MKRRAFLGTLLTAAGATIVRPAWLSSEPVVDIASEWIPLLRTGLYETSRWSHTVTMAMLHDLAQSFDERNTYPIYVEFEHTTGMLPMGTVDRVRVHGDALEAVVSWPPDSEAAIRSGVFGALVPAYVPRRTLSDGTVRHATLVMAALTKTPVVPA